MRVGFVAQDGSEHEADLAQYLEHCPTLASWFQVSSGSASIPTVAGQVVSGRYLVRAWEIAEPVDVLPAGLGLGPECNRLAAGRPNGPGCTCRPGTCALDRSTVRP